MLPVSYPFLIMCLIAFYDLHLDFFPFLSGIGPVIHFQFAVLSLEPLC